MELHTKNMDKDLYSVTYRPTAERVLWSDINGICLTFKSVDKNKIQQLENVFQFEYYVPGNMVIESKIELSFTFDSEKEESSYKGIIERLQKQIAEYTPDPNEIPLH